MTNQTQTQANVQTETKFFNFTCDGVGYLNNPRHHSKGNGLSVTVKALRGNAEEKESSRLDLDVVGSEAKKLITHLMKKFPQLMEFKAKDKPTVFIGFHASDIRSEKFEVKETEYLTIKGRLLKIKFININGERVYLAPVKEHEVIDTVDGSGTVADPVEETAPVSESDQTTPAATSAQTIEAVDGNDPF